MTGPGFCKIFTSKGSIIYSAQMDSSLLSPISVVVKWGLEGKTKTVDAAIAGWNVAEYLAEVTVTRGNCCEPEANGTSL
jgi:hypothetical protein